MGSDWEEKTLGDLLCLQRGFDLPSQDRRAGVIPVMGSAGISGYHDRPTTKGPGVVIGRSGVGSMGITSFIDRDFWALNTTLFVTDFKGNDVLFIYYLLKSINFRHLDTGSAQASLNRNLVYPVRVNVPACVREQRRISTLLGNIERRIELLRVSNLTLESIAQTLFKSWFMDFDPVRAKVEGREPEGMDASTAALFPADFDNSMLGRVPKGWTTRPIGAMVETVGGSTPDTKNEAFWTPASHHWSSPKDLSGATAPVLLDTERKVSDAGLAKISSGLLPIGTLLMSSRAPIGYLSLTRIPVAINQGYIAMLPGGQLPPLYLYFWCQLNMDTIKGCANGSTFMEISKKAFRPILALVPPPSVISQFVDFASAVFDRLAANERQAGTLANLRDTLLPRLISGQLRLPQAEEQVEAALA